MAEKKQSAFVLLSILQEETDENHIMAPSMLIKKVSNALGTTIERRTLYSNIEILRQGGYEISDFKENGKGYYLKSRQFTKGEVLALCNALHASHYIGQKESTELIRKLLSTLSFEDRKEFNVNIYRDNPQKKQDNVLFSNIEIISKAISDNKTLRFRYMKYDMNRKLIPRREEPYIVEPRYIVYQDMRPYLITTSKNHSGFIHYRIDKIRNMIVLDEPVRKMPKVEQTEAYKYVENMLYMFAGETDYVSFRCSNKIMDQMIDLFGTNLRIISKDAETFTIRVRLTQDGAIFLAQQFADVISIVEPEEYKNILVKRLKKALQEYK